MWVEELDIRGFKHLAGELRFDEGLNLVLGPNEAGKSTLHDAILRALYGFGKTERRRQGGVSKMDASRPWKGGVFGLNALVHARGRSFRIEWDFSEHRVTFRDAATGEDLSSEVRLRHDNVRLGEFLLDIGSTEFQSVCCLGQYDLLALEKTEDLVLALQQAVELGATHSGVEDAVALIDGFLREDVGVHVGHLQPNRDGPLRRAQDGAESAADLLEATEEARKEVAALALELGEVEQERDFAERMLRRGEQQELVNRAAELSNRLERARALSDAAASVLDASGAIDRGAMRAAGELRESLARLAAREQELAGEAERQAASVAAAEDRLRQTQAAADALAAYRDIDASAETEVRELLGRLGGVTTDRPTEPEEKIAPDPLMVSYKARRAELRRLEAEQAATQIAPAAWLVAGLVAVVSLVLGAAVHPAGFGGLLVAVGVVLLGRRRVDGSALREALAEINATSVDELDDRLAVDERRVAAASALADERQRRLAGAETTRTELTESLAAALDRANASHVDDVAGRAKAYLQACTSQREYERQTAAAARHDLELSRLRQPVRDLGEKQRERGELEQELMRTYRALALQATNMEEGTEEFARLTEELQKSDRAAQEAQRARSALDAVLEGMTIQQLKEQSASATRDVETHVARFSTLVLGPSEGTVDVEGARTDRDRKALDARGLATQIHDREARLEERALLREQLDHARQREDDLERGRDAAALAREVLRGAAREVHRAFAPHLNKSLERDLPRVTGGRYRQAVVGDDLSIQVVAPETGQLVQASALSRGTQSQIYLVERLAVTTMLDATTGGAPLLLDDPFARFDDKRRRYGLEVLAEMAGGRQVILFSEDERLMGELEAAGETPALIDLSRAGVFP